MEGGREGKGRTYPNQPRSPPCLREGQSLSIIASSPKSAPFSNTANRASASSSVFTCNEEEKEGRRAGGKEAR